MRQVYWATRAPSDTDELELEWIQLRTGTLAGAKRAAIDRFSNGTGECMFVGKLAENGMDIETVATRMDQPFSRWEDRRKTGGNHE